MATAPQSTHTDAEPIGFTVFDHTNQSEEQPPGSLSSAIYPLYNFEAYKDQLNKTNFTDAILRFMQYSAATPFNFAFGLAIGFSERLDIFESLSSDTPNNEQQNYLRDIVEKSSNPEIYRSALGIAYSAQAVRQTYDEFAESIPLKGISGLKGHRETDIALVQEVLEHDIEANMIAAMSLREELNDPDTSTERKEQIAFLMLNYIHPILQEFGETSIAWFCRSDALAYLNPIPDKTKEFHKRATDYFNENLIRIVKTIESSPFYNIQFGARVKDVAGIHYKAQQIHESLGIADDEALKQVADTIGIQAVVSRSGVDPHREFLLVNGSREFPSKLYDSADLHRRRSPETNLAPLFYLLAEHNKSQTYEDETDATINDEELFQIALQILSTLEANGFHPKRSNDNGKKDVKVTLGNLTKEERIFISPKGEEISISIAPQRKRNGDNGYNAIHVKFTFINADSGFSTNIELQILTEEYFRTNPGHGIYKLIGNIGDEQLAQFYKTCEDARNRYGRFYQAVRQGHSLPLCPSSERVMKRLCSTTF
jgi:hypothetical protein